MRIAIVALALILAGCAPKIHAVPNQPDTYRFTLEPIMMTPAGLAREADRYAEEKMIELGYTSFEILHSTCAAGACTYTVRYR